MTRWKTVALIVCVFVLWFIIFLNLLREEEQVLFGSVAATVLTVFLYTKIAKKA